MPMTTASFPSRHALAVLAAACLASACSSVELNPRYDSPPVRLPQPLPVPQAPVPVDVAQPQAIPPSQPVPQALPPIGTVPSQPSAPPQAPLDSTVVAPPRPDAHLVTFTGQLDGVSVVPASRSAASGQLDALYDSNTRTLRWKTSWTGLSGVITSVQFHGPADAGQNGPAAMIWPGPFGPRYEGRATLTPQQAVDLLDGRWYVNVTTSAFPAGEVRAQLRIVR